MTRKKRKKKKAPSKGEDLYCHAQHWPSKTSCYDSFSLMLIVSPLFLQHGRCPLISNMFQKHAFACFFLLTPIYYLHALHIMFTIPIPCLLPYAHCPYSMHIPHYLHTFYHMHSMPITHHLHTHILYLPCFNHTFL